MQKEIITKYDYDYIYQKIYDNLIDKKDVPISKHYGMEFVIENTVFFIIRMFPNQLGVSHNLEAYCYNCNAILCSEAIITVYTKELYKDQLEHMADKFANFIVGHPQWVTNWTKEKKKKRGNATVEFHTNFDNAAPMLGMVTLLQIGKNYEVDELLDFLEAGVDYLETNQKLYLSTTIVMEDGKDVNPTVHSLILGRDADMLVTVPVWSLVEGMDGKVISTGITRDRQEIMKGLLDEMQHLENIKRAAYKFVYSLALQVTPDGLTVEDFFAAVENVKKKNNKKG